MTARVSAVIMAHPRRARFVAELQDLLDRPAEVVWDAGDDDRWSTGRRAMLAYDPQATHHLVAQDDAIVCRDLVAGVEQALGHVPDDSPVCLYAGRVRPFRDLVQQLVNRASDATSWLAMGQLHWGVGIVMPTKWIDDMIAWCDQRSDVANYDKRISRWCQHQGLTVYYPWPSLVDHRDSPSLVPGRGSTGRRAHRFIGAGASALDRRWDGEVVTIPALSQVDRPAPGQIGGPPVKFVSLKYPDYHIPTIGVRFRPVETPQGRIGAAEATTRGAVAYLQSPWMRRRGIRLASEMDQPVPADRPGPTPAAEPQPPAPPTEQPADPAPDGQVGQLPAQPEPKTAAPAQTGDTVQALGGGWWAVVVDGRQVAKVRGEDAARQRRVELTAQTAPAA